MGFKKLVSIVLPFLLLALPMGLVCGQSSSLGVKADDTFVYAYSAVYQSNQTGVQAPDSIAYQADLQYIGIALLDVQGVKVTANTSFCYGAGMGQDVATSDYGGGYVPFYVPPNLTVGSALPSTNLAGSPAGVCYINSTETRSFGIQNRTVNHLQIEMPFEGFQNVVCDAYWDQATGVLLQVTYGYTNQTGDTATAWSLALQLIETSLFLISGSPDASPPVQVTPTASVPELTSVTIAFVAVFILAAAVVCRRLQKNRVPLLSRPV